MCSKINRASADRRENAALLFRGAVRSFHASGGFCLPANAVSPSAKANSIKKNTCKRKCFLAAELGFEPRMNESESLVLPLHHSAFYMEESHDAVRIL